jgi:hypothetical protein
MFLYREHDPTGPLAIPQSSHSWLAWQIGSHWGNRRFPRPVPKAEVESAILLHDVGWTEFGIAPSIDDLGRPLTFDRMPVNLHLEIWRRSVTRVAMHNRYAGLLVASHFAELADRKTTDLLKKRDPADARPVQAFRAEMERLQAGWIEALKVDTRYEIALSGPGRETNQRVLAVCDQISVVLCADLPLPFVVRAIGREGVHEELTVSEVGDRKFRISPWPLEGDRLKIHVEGRRLRTNLFESQSVFETAYRSAPSRRLAFTLQRPSAD